ncbi:MAG: 3-deoxy-D-manno-octulosonic acid transferase [Hyphomicrobiales bacterium]|nr:3-deoxy-D-manno-octulosonic acid transferase [Hyphomicrobiales bacterium]
MPFALRAYRWATLAGTPLTSFVLSHRLKRGKEDPARLAERRGETDVARPHGPLVWMHGASIGEVAAITPLIERIAARDFNVLLTSGTVTSAKLVGQRLPRGVIHQYVPLDAPRYVARFLDHWKPDLSLFTESDLWPNLITMTAERHIPLILVNGRVSERSFNRWRFAPGVIAALLRSFDLCLAQSAAYAARYRDLGAPRITTTGNLKLDVPEPPADQDSLRRLRAAIGDRTTIAAASTHAGEETTLIEMHRRLRHSFPRLLTIIAPRHPDRGPGIVEIAKDAGLTAALRSRGRLPEPEDHIYVVDTLGELGLVYRLAPVVFMGGSLASHGGQNPVEPIKLGAAVLHGPHVWNFAELYEALDSARGAELIADVGRLTVRVGALLTDTAERSAISAAARQTVERLGGALERTLAALDPYFMQIRLERRGSYA